jgi:hypothetical protein
MISDFWELLKGADHPGLIVLKRQMRVGDAVERLLRLCTESGPEEFQNQVRFIRAD